MDTIATSILALGGVVLGHWLSGRTLKKMTQASLNQRESERRQSLAMAALGERLMKHQEAYSLWYKMSRKVSANPADQDELIRSIDELREWLIHNGLYLDSRARNALWECMHVSAMYENTLKIFRAERQNNKPAIEAEQDMKKEWAFIKRGCGQIIEECVDIPGFAQQDNFPVPPVPKPNEEDSSSA